MDIHRSDPLGGMGVTVSGFSAMTSTLMEIAETCCAGRLVLTLEGGYDLEGLRDSVKAILEELMEKYHTDPRTVASGTRMKGLEPLLERIRTTHPETS